MFVFVAGSVTRRRALCVCRGVPARRFVVVCSAPLDAGRLAGAWPQFYERHAPTRRHVQPDRRWFCGVKFLADARACITRRASATDRLRWEAGRETTFVFVRLGGWIRIWYPPARARAFVAGVFGCNPGGVCAAMLPCARCVH